MDIIRLKRDKNGRSRTRYSEGFFGGLFGEGIWVDNTQLKQRFKGQIPGEIEIEIRAVVHDELREDLDRDLRSRVIKEKRLAKQEEIEAMQVKGALARLDPNRKKKR